MFFIAFRYLFSKKFRFLPSFSVFVAFFGVFLSILTLILVSSVIGGFRSDFEKLIIGTRPHISIYNQGGVFTSLDFLQNIKGKEITSVAPVVSGEGIVSFQGTNSGAIVKGVQPQYFQSRKLLKNSIVEGVFEEGSVVIGRELAKKMGIRIGDSVSVFSSKMRRTLFGTVPVYKEFKVSGFFAVNMYFYDSSSIYISLQDSQNLFLEEGLANVIEIELLNPQKVDDLNFENLNFGSHFTTWKSENGSFIEAIATQEAVMFLILNLFVIVSGFIIFSTVSSVVHEKKRQTAVLQSFGFENAKVLGVFIIFGMMIVLPAVLLGTSLGVALAINLEAIKNWLESVSNTVVFDSAHYFLSYIPSVVEWQKVAKIVFFVWLFCLLCVVFPAFRATRKLPNEVLRIE